MKADVGDVFRYRLHDEDEIYVVLETAIQPDGQEMVIVVWSDGEISNFHTKYVNDESDVPLGL